MRINRTHLCYLFLLLVPLSSFAASTDTSDTVMHNINEGLKGVSKFAMALFYVVGFSLSIGAIYRLKKFGHRTAFMHVEAGVIGPAVQFFVGVALMFSKTLFQSINQTLFNSPYIGNDMSYAMSSGLRIVKMIAPIVGIIQLIGLFAFLRGWMILARLGKQGAQPGTVSKGIVHLIGGILAVNITTTVNVVVNTLGLG